MLMLDEFLILLPVSDFFVLVVSYDTKVIKCVLHVIASCTCNMNMMASGLTVMGPLFSFKQTVHGHNSCPGWFLRTVSLGMSTL
jgi:hypothetical protein